LHPRRISAGPTSHAVLQATRRVESVTRVPGTSRGGYARHRQERALRLRSSVSARATAPSTQVERAVRKPVRAVRGSPASGAATRWKANATGIGWCQRAAGRKPHSRARKNGSNGCARASNTVAEVVGRRRDPEKRDPQANGTTRTGIGAHGTSARGIRELQRCRRSVPRWPSRSADRGPSRAPERASRGRGFRAMEGTPGRIPNRFVHANRCGAASATLEANRDRANDSDTARGATGVSEVRHARTTTGRQRPSRWKTPSGGSRAARRSEWP